jgi:xylan 1,4-beta-xylosidase
VNHYRIDETHSNSYTLWKALGEPQKPTPAQYTDLEQAGKLATLESGKTINIANNSANVNFKLPRQGVSLLVIEWK